MRDYVLRVRAEAHVAAMARRSRADHERLGSILAGRCWPGGVPDRTDPAALGWVRDWARACPHTTVPECTCGQGRCAVCN